MKPSKMPPLLFAILGIVCVGFGYLLGASLQGRRMYLAGADATRMELHDKFAAAGLLPVSAPLAALPGKVKSVNGDVVDVEVMQVVRDPFETPAPTLRHVTADAKTKIVILVQKTPAEIVQDQQAFQEAQQNFLAEIRKGGTNLFPPTPPSDFMEKPAQLSDLAPGMAVTVSAASDILRAESFTATNIKVLPAAPGTLSGPSSPPPTK